MSDIWHREEIEILKQENQKLKDRNKELKEIWDFLDKHDIYMPLPFKNSTFGDVANRVLHGGSK